MLVGVLLAGNETKVVSVSSNVTVVVEKVVLADIPREGSATIIADGGEAAITIPRSVVESSGCAVVVVMSVINASTGPFSAAEVREGTQALGEVVGLINVNIVSLDTRVTQAITGLIEPILITLPVNRSSRMTCVHFDESMDRWSSEGLTTVPGEPDSLLVCATTHLTLFGSIIEGMGKALTCSQASLLSAESYEAFLIGSWYHDLGSLLLWSLLAGLSGLLLTALVLDYRRFRMRHWRDEDFLIETKVDSRDVGLQHQAENAELSHGGCCAYEVSEAYFALKTTCDALRNVIDDVMSKFFRFFGEVRTFVEGLRDGLGDLFVSETAGRDAANRREALAIAVQAAVMRMMAKSSERSACASMWLCFDDIGTIREGVEMQNKKVEKQKAIHNTLGSEADCHAGANANGDEDCISEADDQAASSDSGTRAAELPSTRFFSPSKLLSTLNAQYDSALNSNREASHNMLGSATDCNEGANADADKEFVSEADSQAGSTGWGICAADLQSQEYVQQICSRSDVYSSC